MGEGWGGPERERKKERNIKRKRGKENMIAKILIRKKKNKIKL